LNRFQRFLFGVRKDKPLKTVEETSFFAITPLKQGVNEMLQIS